MKKILPALFSKHFFLLTVILTSIFGMCTFSDSYLYARNKKSKHAKKKKIERKYKQLQGDFSYTVENFVVILEEWITLCQKLDSKVQDLESKSLYRDQELVGMREYLQNLVTVCEEVKDKVQDLEPISMYQDQKLVDIQDYLYKKSLDPSYCPFDLFIEWYNVPFPLYGLDEERCILEEVLD